MSGLRLDAAAAQWVGSRERQNDAALYADSYAMVADGAGADVDAASAAQLAVQVWARAAQDADGSAAMLDALLHAPESAAAALTQAHLAYSCTLAGAFLDRDGRLWLTSVGDSRVVLIRNDEVLAASRPHNLAAERLLANPTKSVSPYDSATLTRYVTATHSSTPDLLVLTAEEGDVIVAATDGIDAYVPLEAMIETVSSTAPDLAAAHLVDLVRGVPEADNATCVVARVTAGVPSRW